MNKAGSTCPITNEQSVELVVRSTLEDSNTVGIACNDILAIFWEGLICRIVSTVVEFISAILRSQGFAVADFDS